MKKVFVAIARYVYAVLCSVYLFTIGIFSSKHRIVISRIATHFGYPTKSKKKAAAEELMIPKVDLSEIAPGTESVKISEQDYAEGNVTRLELAAIIKLVHLHNPENIFEIGTFDGRTTLNMAINSSPEAKVYTLDLPKSEINTTAIPLNDYDKKMVNKEASGTRFVGTEYEKKIAQLYGDSASFDYSPYNNKMNFIFVDGAHSYDYVMSDAKKALKLLKDGQGIILFHDYGEWDGVTRALEDLQAEVDEFSKLRHIKGTSLVSIVFH